MIINILHLYYDLLNLYGESGNIKALTYSLKTQNIKVKIDKLSINDEIDFNKYDLVYIGCGTENNLLLALNYIKRYKKEIEKFILNNKFIIATGNSLDLFGKAINDVEALSIFNYKTKFIENRIVGDKIIKSNLTMDNILGFLNNGSEIIDNDNPLFAKELGYNYKNFYGTFLLGPILVRNPELNRYITTKLIKEKYPNFKLKKVDFKLDKIAYDNYFETYYKN